jgi:8-oxo-dGTP diphosphatase
VAELVDALASGASESNLMEVQVFSCAPTKVCTNELPFCYRKIMEVVAFSHAAPKSSRAHQLKFVQMNFYFAIAKSWKWWLSATLRPILLVRTKTKGNYMAIIVGGVIENNGKYLLVQETQKKCYGKWNLPAGHLDPNETIFDAVKREIKEESGVDVELTGVCQIGNRKLADDIFVSVIFTARQVGGEIAYDEEEIMDVKWFSYDEIMNMKENLRNIDLILGAINNARAGIITPLDVVEIYNEPSK